jgi:hypothetical protein
MKLKLKFKTKNIYHILKGSYIKNNKSKIFLYIFLMLIQPNSMKDRKRNSNFTELKIDFELRKCSLQDPHQCRKLIEKKIN